MPGVEIGTAPFVEFDHVGIMVRNIEEAMRYYTSLGVVGEWRWWGPAFSEVRVYGAVVDGSTYKPEVRLAVIGDTTIELIQPGETHSLWNQFIEKHGDGVQHIAFRSENIDRDEAVLIERGVKVPWRCRWIDGGGASYFETDAVGGMMLELIQRPATTMHA